MRVVGSISKSHDRPSAPGGAEPEGVAGLLAVLGDTPAEQGMRYEQLRAKLIFFFSRRALESPEDLADESLDRLARRVAEGIAIVSLAAFALGIARYVAQEYSSRKKQTESRDGAFWNNVPADSTTQNEEEIDQANQVRMAHMERCLKTLPSADQKLIRGYYLGCSLGERNQPLEARRRMADRLGISANTLRQRVFLARTRLRDCLMNSMSKAN